MLSEAMLACAGVINRMGSIAAGSTVSDYHESEQQRQISVSTTLMHLEWQGKKFNILDCPGYADFISEALGALRVSDLAVVTVHANHGSGVGTDAVWKCATDNGIPEGHRPQCVRQRRDGFRQGAGPAPRALRRARLPADRSRSMPGPGFNQVLDVPRNEVITYATDKSGKFTEAPGDRRPGWSGPSSCTTSSSNSSPSPTTC